MASPKTWQWVVRCQSRLKARVQVPKGKSWSISRINPKGMIRKPSQLRLWLRFSMLNEPVESGEDVGSRTDKENLISPRNGGLRVMIEKEIESIWRWLKSDVVIWFRIFGDKIHGRFLKKFLERIDWGSTDSCNLGSFQDKIQRWLEYRRRWKYLYALAGSMPKDWRLEDRANLWRDQMLADVPSEWFAVGETADLDRNLFEIVDFRF